MKRTYSKMLTPEPQDFALPLAEPTATANANASSNTSRKIAEAPPPKKQVHKQSGYVWEREEDAPGYAWQSKRAQDEIQRSYDAIVQRDTFVGAKYGDPALIAPADTPWEKII